MIVNIATNRSRRAYGGVPDAQRRALRHRKLVDAFFSCLATRPADEVTLRSVTSEAGLNPRYVYEEFGSLEGLVAVGFDIALGEITREIESALVHQPVNADTDIADMVSAICGFVEREPHKARLVVVDSLRMAVLADSRRRAIETITEQFAHRLARHAAYVHIDRGRIALTARFLVGATGEVIVGTVDQTIPGKPTDHLAALTALFAGALTGAPADTST